MPSYRRNINLEGYATVATRRGGVVTFGPHATRVPLVGRREVLLFHECAPTTGNKANNPQPKIIYLYIGRSYKIQPALTKGSGLLGNASSSEPISIPYPSVGTPSTCPASFL